MKIGEPYCNSFGIGRIRTRVMNLLVAMKVYALSKLEDEYIRDSIISQSCALVDDLHDNWESYGIASMGAASDITQTISNLTYAIMQKGNDSTYLKFLTKTHNVNENVMHSAAVQGQTEEKKGMLDFLFKRKRR